MKASASHRARKELFQRGIRQGRLSREEIDRALPPGSLSDAERWLLYYSLRAAGVEIAAPAAGPDRPGGGLTGPASTRSV